MLVESVADQPQSARIEPAHHSADNHSPLGPTYIGIAGTFINVQPANPDFKMSSYYLLIIL